MNQKNISYMILIVLATMPLSIANWAAVMVKPHYQYIPLLGITICFLIFMRLRTDLPASRRATPGIYTIAFYTGIISTCIVQTAASVAWAPWLGTLSLISFLFCALLWIQVAYGIRTWDICVLCLMLSPLPPRIEIQLLSFLQTLSTQIASSLIDLLSIIHIVRGNVIEVAGKQLFVDEACSGIVSLFSVLAIGLICSSVQLFTVLRTALLLLSSVCFATVLNALRISTICLSASWFHLDLAHGWKHDALGLTLFFGACGLIYSACCLFDVSLLHKSTGTVPISGSRPLAQVRVPYVPFAIVMYLCLLAVLPIATLMIQRVNAFDVLRMCQNFGIGETQLPNTTWVLSSQEIYHRPDKPFYGEYSVTTNYINPSSGERVTLSFDYPFPAIDGWKDLTACYKANGWELLRQRSIASENWNYVFAVFRNQDSRFGYLYFADFDGSGNPISPHNLGFIESIMARMRRTRLVAISPYIFQTQAWSESHSELSDEQCESILKLFNQFRETTRLEFSEGLTAIKSQ